PRTYNRSMKLFYTWELGSNLGHIERGVAIGEALRQRGFTTAFAVRDVRSSAALLSKHSLAFFASPLCAAEKVRPFRPSMSYSDILLCTDFGNTNKVLAQVRAWIGLIEAVGIDALLIDHSPIALLAARILGLPTFLVGSGFDVPPQTEPTPALLGDDSATESKRFEIDRRLLASVNSTLEACKREPICRVAELFTNLPYFATTFPELDVYEPRTGVNYVGPVLPVSAKPKESWRIKNAVHCYAYLRTDTPGFENLLEALSLSEYEVLCVVPDATEHILARYNSDQMRVLNRPIDLESVLRSADVVVSYGGAAVVAQSLLAGVPMLIVSNVPERVMNGRRVETLGAGAVITRIESPEGLGIAIRRLVEQHSYLNAARSFARKYSGRAKSAAEIIADDVAAKLNGSTAGTAS
ncbi:MAG TPA: nucleotide disphospho-sugar-binding domain-containing protein, partial [Steroidobacteraceae bacterium]|nr:nucleotide disphospho-sugar-binding domain-containing protein [Steroidobacteraceae bacterium]